MQTQQQPKDQQPTHPHTHSHPHQQKQTPSPALDTSLQNKVDIHDEQQQQEQKVQLLQEYFRSLQKKHYNQHAENLGEFIEESVYDGIKNGDVDVSAEKGSLEKIIFQSRVKQGEKTRKEEQQEEKQKKRMIIQMNLRYLDQQVSGSKRSKQKDKSQKNQFSEIDSYNAVLSRKQHQQFLHKLAKQRSQLQIKKKQLQEKQKSKQTEQQKLKRQAQEQLQQKQKQEKKKKILEKLQQQKKYHQQKVKDEQQNNRRLSQVKNKKFLHQKLQEKYNTEILIPSLEQKKKKLKQIRQMSKNFNVEDINNHEKQYIRKRQQILSTSQAKRNKQQWHYKLPEKSQKLSKLLQEQSVQNKLRLQQKKRKLQQKIQRQQQFVTYLKQKFPPTIDPKKRQQIEQRLRLKSETKQKEKPDGKTLGMNYLQEVKSQRKKSANSQMQFQRKNIVLEQSQTLNKKSQTNYLKTRKAKQYEQMRERRIQKLINSDTTDRSQKIMKLQIQAGKIIEQQKRKQEKLKHLKNKKNANNLEEEDAQSTNLLLASIKAKMGIIDLYNKQ